MIGNAAKAKLLVFSVFFIGAVTGALILNVYETRIDGAADSAPEKKSQREVNQVYDALGLSAHAFQSLYHFTVGGPVDDARLTTEPGYAWEKTEG